MKTVLTLATATLVALSSSSAYTASDDCDPNYDPCVPVASDVDCASGSGNGPAYVRGPVRVTGTDIDELDRDGDGVACEVRAKVMKKLLLADFLAVADGTGRTRWTRRCIC